MVECELFGVALPRGNALCWRARMLLGVAGLGWLYCTTVDTFICAPTWMYSRFGVSLITAFREVYVGGAPRCVHGENCRSLFPLIEHSTQARQHREGWQGYRGGAWQLVDLWLEGGTHRCSRAETGI